MRSLSPTDFPALAEGLAYLDSAASSWKPTAVLDAMDGYYRRYCANIHRGAYRLSVEATEAYEEARVKVARFIGAAQPEDCIFTRGTTEALNMLVSSWGEDHVGPGDDVVLSIMEHHSNLVPWQQLAIRKGARLVWLEMTPSGQLCPESIERALAGRPKVLSLAWVSNAFGTIHDVAALAARFRAAGALVVIDGAQGVPHLPTDVKALGCDFLAFSGHKMCGPTGIGVLWGRDLESLRPYHYGGDMIAKVTRELTTFADLPNRLEAGTPNIAGAIGLGAAVDYLTSLGMDAVRAHSQELLAYAFSVLGELPGMKMMGPCDPLVQSGVISFDYNGIHPHDLATLLDQQGVCIRAGHHCCQPLMRELGIAGTARASFYVYNTRADVDRLAAALLAAREVFANVAL